MTARPIPLILAAGLLILIGLSGMAVGGQLLGAAGNGDVSGVDIRGAALGLGTTIAAYGFLSVVAAVGLLTLRRWGWRLGVLLILLGLVALGSAAAAGGLDPIIGFGAVLWGATLACLFASETRRALASPAPAPGSGERRERDQPERD
jgi:hypothetical protein